MNVLFYCLLWLSLKVYIEIGFRHDKIAFFLVQKSRWNAPSATIVEKVRYKLPIGIDLHHVAIVVQDDIPLIPIDCEAVPCALARSAKIQLTGVG